tara:strand:- start:509 stop:727 length:219 start_codon:yes stop_codon:yes gene_type:complete
LGSESPWFSAEGLDFDYFSPEIRKELATERPSDNLCEFKYFNSVKWGWAHTFSFPDLLAGYWVTDQLRYDEL